ncbi:MAG: methyltransferase domain-containing protein [Terriglobia bacterium]
MSDNRNSARAISQGPPLETYTRRLFGKGPYGRHHNRRYSWLSEKITRLAGSNDVTVLEVGCFEGRSLNYIPVPVRKYVGLDAGWGGGLQRARQFFRERPEVSFIESNQPRDIASIEGRFDFIVAMETLEHVDPPLVELYIKAFSEKLDGYLLITAPNEKGLALLIKAVGAKFLGVDRIYPYTASEFFWGLMGRMERVHRSEHKGFDYRALVNLVGKYFRYVSVEGVSPVRRPLQLGLTIGIVASQNPIP